jgi:WD40 repeat protein
MGRRNPRQRASAFALVAVLALSFLAGDGVSPLDSIAPVNANTPSEPAPDEGPEVAAASVDEKPIAEGAPRAEYPSSRVPQPLDGPVGPFPLLSNIVTNHGFDDAWALGYRGAGVRVVVVDEGVDFGHLDLQGTQAVVTDPNSTYLGWPIVYDPRSLTTYLRTGYPDNTYFANTTRTGLGPFDVTHTIQVDGTNDFGDRERWAAGPRDNGAGSPHGDKSDWDLTGLSLTRNDDDWYVGYPMYLRERNASFVVLFDVDNGTSGAYVAPGGATVDTNASHADRVNDVAWSPDGLTLATVAGDRLVRLWDRNGAVLRTMSGHASEPLSVAWSPDGTKVASADKDSLRLWDAATGALLREIQYVPFGDVAISESGILAFSPNGTWVAAATFKYVHLFDVATGAKFGTLWAENTEVNAIAFRPGFPDQIAVGLGTNSAVVYVLNATNVKPFTPVTRAVANYTLASHLQPVLEVSFSPLGDRLVTGSRDNTAKLWDVESEGVIQDLLEAQSWVLAADWEPSGTQFVVTTQGLVPSVSPSFLQYTSAGAFVRQVTQSQALYGVDWSVTGEIATGGGDLTAKLWTSGGTFVRTFVAHRPDFALYTHGFSRYEDRENKYVHGAEFATWYAWNATAGAWEASPLASSGGRQAAFQFGEQLFNEFAIPRALLGDPSGLSASLFSMHENGSRAQDTVPSDRNINFLNLDFSPGWVSLSAWAWREIEQYSIAGLTSASSAFHFGFHPAPTVQREFGALGLLVVDTTNASEYDRVYLDMNDDKVFDPTDVFVSRASPIATIDTYNATSGLPGQDAYPDVSAGMVYFIADGVNPVPYSARLAARKIAEGLQVRTPGAGDLVAFAGDFGVDAITGAKSEHGTRIASALVAQGRLPTPLTGLADASRLVTILNGLSDVVEAWTFAVEGYDGVPGTSDDAHVVVSAFNFPTTHNDGWDVLSRTADFLSMHVSRGRAVFVASAGDYGFGYGTVASPASGPNVLAAGRAGDFTLRSILTGGPEGPNPHARDAAVLGSRGPTPQGFVKPELLAADTATLAIPLHAAGDGSTAVSSSPMVGSDVSAAVVAGAVALLYEAFTDRTARAPTVSEVRSLLLSGADDAGHDVLAQGAGYLNVSRSVRLAARTANAGLEVSPPMWHPGTYRGNTHEAFTRLLYAGDTSQLALTVSNRGTASITANLEAVAYRKVGEYVHANATRIDAYQPNGDIALWLNDTGVWKVNAATLSGVRVVPPVAGLWANAELVKVTAYADLRGLVDRQGVEFRTNYSYALRAYDWTIDWSNWFGLDPFPAPAFFPAELNTVAETFHTSNVLEVRAAFPATSLHEGLVVSLEDVGTPTFIDGLAWTFVIEFFDRAPWLWLSLSQGAVNVPAGLAQGVNASVSVPATVGIGSYEGAILVRDATNGVTTTVPVLVNVGARAPSLVFGADASSAALYDNHRLFGGYDKTLSSATRLRNPQMGDWRFFFFEIPDQGLFAAPVGLRVLIRTAWQDAPSDLDTFAFNRGGADAATQGNVSAYGPFPLRQVAKSEELDKPEFRTLTGGGEEVVAFDLRSGLNVIAVRAFALRGLETNATLTVGQAGWASAPSNLDIVTRDLAGRESFPFLSNMNFPALRASAVGPATTTAFTDLEIPQDVQSWWNFPGWGEWMVRATFSYTFTVEKALILEVHIAGKADTEDLDMAVFRDGNANGILDPEEYLTIDCQPVAPGLCQGGSLWNYNADGDADERVKWVAPGDGQYIVKVLGFTIPSGLGHFDMDIAVTLDTGTGYQVPEAPRPAEIVNGTQSGLAPYVSVTLSVSWDFPSDTVDAPYGGAVLLGLPNAPGVFVIPVSVTIDRIAPRIVGFKVTALGGNLNDADNRTTDDRAPQLTVSLEDPDLGQLDRDAVRILFDGSDVTPRAIVSILFTARAGRLALWEGTATVTPTDVAEGTHTVEAWVGDRAGNLANATFTFVVDVTAPILGFTTPDVVYTTLATHTIQGATEPFAWYRVRGNWTQTDASGAFSETVVLENGTNALVVGATDWFDEDASPGNPTSHIIVIVRDLVAPEIPRLAAETFTTKETQVAVTGLVQDRLSVVEPADPTTLILEINGNPATIRADGTFREVVTLAVDGTNTITAIVRDPVGNLATETTTVTRDTAIPTLVFDSPPPTQTESLTVVIAGKTEPGAFVTVNGISVPAPGGAFGTNVTLAYGTNTVVVVARDAVGNVDEERFTINVVTPARTSPLLLPAGLLILGVVLGVLFAIVLPRYGVRVPFLPTRARKEETDEERPSEETEAAAAAVEVPEEMPSGPEQQETPAEGAIGDEHLLRLRQAHEARVARLRKAYEEGRISKEVYEENLRKLEESAP